MNLNLKGKYALVTGGSRGIGRRTALTLAEEGCNVAICARTQEALDRTVSEIRALGVEAIGVQADVRKSEDIERVMRAVIDAWKTIHILVNNAGGGGPTTTGPLEEVPEDVWMETLSVNTLAAMRFTRLALPHMRKLKWGRVVTLTSKQGREGGGKPWYNMAKSAEISLMKTFAMNFEIARDGVTFNSVAPGAVLTEIGNWADFLKENPKKLEERVKTTLPLGRLGLPEEVANVVVFICSERASLLNGACIPVDGAEGKAF